MKWQTYLVHLDINRTSGSPYVARSMAATGHSDGVVTSRSAASSGLVSRDASLPLMWSIMLSMMDRILLSLTVGQSWTTPLISCPRYMPPMGEGGSELFWLHFNCVC